VKVCVNIGLLCVFVSTFVVGRLNVFLSFILGVIGLPRAMSVGSERNSRRGSCPQGYTAFTYCFSGFY
jgi:hypothetical protein